uniref:DUF6098 family protein n=1 Tax=Yinghuangia sp. YIM S09857 TaxID=3436929 RepID=UPI003F53C7F2
MTPDARNSRPRPPRTPDGTLPELASLSELAGMVRDSDEELFLRWSHGPAADSGTSIDHESGLEMPGLSATVLDAPAWWTRPPTEWLARQIHKYAQLGAEPGRYGWVLTGRQVARGVDHEPLLDKVVPIARLGEPLVREARHVYETRFQVGRDSRSPP